MGNFPVSCLLLWIMVLQFGDVSIGHRIPSLGGKKLIIGVPKKNGFPQFVNLELNPLTKDLVHTTGFSIDVFSAAVAGLAELGYNVSFEFKPFIDKEGNSAGTYDQLLQQIPQGKYDAVVGDVTIVANRSRYVDFTMPYLESGVRMLVAVQHHRHLKMWIFLRPFSWDLWLSILGISIFIGVVLRIMERNANKDNDMSHDTPRREQLPKISLLWLPVKQALLPEGHLVVKNCSKFVLMVWLILAVILMQSYSANLTSMLTIDQLKPSFPSVDELIREKCYVGYQNGSFVRNFLIERLKFDPSKLKAYNDIPDYRDALTSGNNRGGVAAIFAEIPYIKVFLQVSGSKYMMAGPTYHTNGFGFAFPLNSSLTSYFSRAILNVTESDAMDYIERKYFGTSDEDDLQNQFGSQDSSDTHSLTSYSFVGLFMITGIATMLALFVSESFIWKKPVSLAKAYSLQYLCSPRSARTNESTDS